MKRFFDPSCVPNEDRRWYLVGLVHYMGGLFNHTVYLIGAWLLGLHGLALFNVGSVLCWIVVLRIQARGALRHATALALLEMLAHAIFASWVLGWASGFALFLLPFGLYGQVVRLPRAPRFALAAVGIATPLAIALFLQRDTGALPGSGLAWLGSVNIATTIGMLSIAIAALESTASRLERELAQAHAESERLLQNVLPPTIAARLKREGGVIADAHESVSVVFCDLVGFTTFAASTSPEKVVEMLNHVVRGFDELAASIGLEKIKTIGDAYMAAAGVPDPCDDHADRAAEMALSMMAFIERSNRELGTALEVRIGVHSGPVVAGVIGKRKFAYDLWGDTVNTASRMESHGIPGKIQLSASTATALSSRFRLEPRGSIDVKGKGPTEAYFLVGRSEGAVDR